MFYLSAVRIRFLTVKYFQDFPACGSRASCAVKLFNEPLLRPYGLFLLSIFNRKIRISHSLLNENPDNDDHDIKKRKKRANKGQKVSVIMEDNKQNYMYMTELEKYATRNKLTLVHLGNDIKDKPKYKLQKVSGVFQTADAKQDKNKKVKHVIIREGISKNDLQIKISQILKFLEKNFKVMCMVESENHAKSESIISEISANELQKYSLQKIQAGKHVKLIFEAKNAVKEASK